MGFAVQLDELVGESFVVSCKSEKVTLRMNNQLQHKWTVPTPFTSGS